MGRLHFFFEKFEKEHPEGFGPGLLIVGIVVARERSERAKDGGGGGKRHNSTCLKGNLLKSGEIKIRLRFVTFRFV